MGLNQHPVVRRGVAFLADTVRNDGSWPIDTNLDTWTTTMAVNALADERPGNTREWLLGQQFSQVHPYTRAEPGAWAWTDLPGGVPDADDTAGALLALRKLDPANARAATAGVLWLLDVQNRDGGIPTFCKGWGKLPFDRSCPDITAHAVRAWAAWRDALPPLRRRVDAATTRALLHITRSQRPDGSWVPLWFGNQAAANEENPMYGTTRVLLLGALLPEDVRSRAERWVLEAQHADGGFGADRGVAPSVEETAMAVEALAGSSPERGRGVDWLKQATANGTRFSPSPIGLYFAKLWYSERLYPIIFTVSALKRAPCPD
jgi:squalene-hopene/tetraprenyl-beta-curcumene cyclase